MLFLVTVQSACALEEKEGRLNASEVTGNNWKQFEAQLKRDLPVGTPYEEIDAYLKKIRIEYLFSDYKSAFQAVVRNIDRHLLIFPVDLDVHVYVSRKDKRLTRISVEEIRWMI